MEASFSAHVYTEKYNPCVSGECLYNKILAQEGGKATIIAKEEPNFWNIATAEDTGLYAMQDEYGMSFYYRGNKNLLNNNIIFGGFQWKIICINGDGSVRLIYNGTCPNDTCTINSTGINTQIGDSPWHSIESLSNADAKYLGYMFGGANGVASTSREEALRNETSSDIKVVLENWYKNNIYGEPFESMIVDNLFVMTAN